jgi:hypothetical protein
VVKWLALTCKFPVWQSWEGPETTTSAYGNWCKLAHTVQVVNNFSINFSCTLEIRRNPRHPKRPTRRIPPPTQHPRRSFLHHHDDGGRQTLRKDIYVMYADFKGAFNAADHRIMFKHMRQLGMPPTLVDTCEQLYGVSTPYYITPYGSTPSIDINRGTLEGDTLSPSPPSYLPSSTNHSSVGSRWAAEVTSHAPQPLTLTP